MRVCNYRSSATIARANTPQASILGNSTSSILPSPLKTPKYRQISDKMPTTRSQARSMNMLENQHSQPETESPFAAISTAAMNRNSSMFNHQASVAQPEISRPENEQISSDGQAGSTSLFGDWKPSQQPLKYAPGSIFAMDDSIPSAFTVNGNTPAPSARTENTPSLFASSENPPNQKTPLLALSNPPRPHPSTFFGMRMDYSRGPKPYSQAANQTQQSKEEDNSLPPDEYARAFLQRLSRVETILQNVNCLDDLTEDVVRKLMATDYGLLTIMKFEVTFRSISHSSC